MIFGDSPTLRNDRYVPNIHAILQSGNLFTFGINNPVMWADPTGLFIQHALNSRSKTEAILSLTSAKNLMVSSSSGMSGAMIIVPVPSGRNVAPSGFPVIQPRQIQSSTDIELWLAFRTLSERVSSGLTLTRNIIGDTIGLIGSRLLTSSDAQGGNTGQPSATPGQENLNDVDPDNLPEGWRRTDHNGHTHIRDADGRIRIRIDPPDPRTPFPHRHHYDPQGRPLDSRGQVVSPRSPDAHIRIGR